MKNRFRAFLLLGLLVAGLTGVAYLAPDAEAQSTSGARPTPTPPDPEEEEIRIDTEVVNILFTAQDKDRRLLLGLKKEDIRILEDGKVQEIGSFTRQVDLPLSLAILIDTSISQERTLPEEKMAAISFLESFIRPEKDEVAVVSFTGESTLEQGMTSNLTRLRRAIDRVKFVAPAGYLGGGVMSPTPPISGTGTQVAGSTAIWDSIWVTAEDVLGPAPERTRRAIILLSDGVNTSGRKKLDDAVQAAQRSEAVIYSIGIGDNFYAGVDEGALKRISERTGGRAFFPRNERQLREAFKQIEDEMRSQYLLAYEPTNPALDGSYRRIEIQVANPELAKQKVKLTHREGYFAKDQKNRK
jgi:Ca-activated chloride channel family protein